MAGPSPCSKWGATVLPSAVRPCECSIGTALSRTPKPWHPIPILKKAKALEAVGPRVDSGDCAGLGAGAGDRCRYAPLRRATARLAATVGAYWLDGSTCHRLPFSANRLPMDCHRLPKPAMTCHVLPQSSEPSGGPGPGPLRRFPRVTPKDLSAWVQVAVGAAMLQRSSAAGSRVGKTGADPSPGLSPSATSCGARRCAGPWPAANWAAGSRPSSGRRCVLTKDTAMARTPAPGHLRCLLGAKAGRWWLWGGVNSCRRLAAQVDGLCYPTLVLFERSDVPASVDPLVRNIGPAGSRGDLFLSSDP